MPILTHIIERTASDRVARIDVRQGVRAILADAIEAEGFMPAPWDDTSADDIGRAASEGHVFWAAHLLQGATETYVLDRVVRHLCETGRISDWMETADRDCDEWLASSTWTEHAHRCDACNGVTFGDDYWTPDTCGSCGAALEN